MLAVWLLGTFRAVAGEGAFDDSRWRLRKARAVVKLLSLAPAHSLPRERLLDLLWPDLGPEAASNNLRYTLHVARRALAGAGGPALSFLRTDGDQVHLFPGGEVWTDVGAFEAAAAEARRKRERQGYARAVGLYAGDLLPEDPYEDWAAGRREELRRLYLTLLLEQAEVAQEAGDGEGEGEALTRAITADPAHEAAHQGLMRLHARSGQRHLALRQFQHLREALRRELDAEPDPASQRLYEDILSGAFPGTDAPAADAPAADAPAADTSRREESAGERGARRMPGSRAAAPTPGRRHNLPTPMTSFVGREVEVSEVRRLLLGATGAPEGRASERRASEGRPRLVTLTGSGGCGKTRLALQVAESLVGRDVGGQAGRCTVRRAVSGRGVAGGTGPGGRSVPGRAGGGHRLERARGARTGRLADPGGRPGRAPPVAGAGQLRARPGRLRHPGRYAPAVRPRIADSGHQPAGPGDGR